MGMDRKFKVSDKLLGMLGEEIGKMLHENRDEGNIEYFPGFKLYITIDKNLPHVLMKIPVKEFIPDENNRNYIFIGKHE